MEFQKCRRLEIFAGMAKSEQMLAVENAIYAALISSSESAEVDNPPAEAPRSKQKTPSARSIARRHDG